MSTLDFMQSLSPPKINCDMFLKILIKKELNFLTPQIFAAMAPLVCRKLQIKMKQNVPTHRNVVMPRHIKKDIGRAHV